MCLYPSRVRNPAYDDVFHCRRESPFLYHSSGFEPFDYMLDVPCGRCWQCLRQKRFDIVFRLKVEQATIPVGTRSYFVTLTFDNFNLDRFADDYAIPVRRWLDLLRKRYGQFRYWFTSELGEANGRLHFHGILFGLPDIPYSELCASYRYGRSWFGYVDNTTCGYITKYIVKQRFDSSNPFRPYVICTKSIGCGFGSSGLDYVRKRLTDRDVRSPDPSGIRTTMRFDSDPILYSYSLPLYYVNKLYSKLELFRRRLYNYTHGLRYRFRGVVYSTRELWLAAIVKFRREFPTAYRFKFSTLIPFVSVKERVRSLYNSAFEDCVGAFSLDAPPASVLLSDLFSVPVRLKPFPVTLPF